MSVGWVWWWWDGVGRIELLYLGLEANFLKCVLSFSKCLLIIELCAPPTLGQFLLGACDTSLSILMLFSR